MGKFLVWAKRSSRKHAGRLKRADIERVREERAAFGKNKVGERCSGQCFRLLIAKIR